MEASGVTEKQDYHYPPKGFWTERGANGELLYCHKTRQRGQTYIIRKTLDEITKILKDAEK